MQKNIATVWDSEQAQQLVEALLSIDDAQTMQNFLRQQFEESDPLYSLNIDFIKYTAQIFGAFVKYMNPALMGLAE